MLPFYILTMLPILIQHTKFKLVSYKKKNKLALCSFFILLLILLACRQETIGNDTQGYIRYFYKFGELDLSETTNFLYEIGFVLYNKLIYLISDNHQIYLAITAFITLGMIFKTYYRLSEDTALVISIFCIMSTFVMLFSGIRQMIAVSFGFIAYEYVVKENFISFVVITLIAMIFHNSAFMLFFMYPIYHAKITKKWLLIVIPVMGLIFTFNKEIFNSLLILLSRYSRFDTVSSSTGAYTMIILFTLFAIYAYIIPNEKILDCETLGLRNFLLFSICIQMFAPLHALAMRMNYYYIMFIPLLITKINRYRSEKWRKVTIFARNMMIVFFLSYFYLSAQTSPLNVFPYYFFWEII